MIFRDRTPKGRHYTARPGGPQRGPNGPNVQDSHGITPLHWAAQSGDIATIAALLTAGADPNAQTTRKHTTPRSAPTPAPP